MHEMFNNEENKIKLDCDYPTVLYSNTLHLKNKYLNFHFLGEN